MGAHGGGIHHGFPVIGVGLAGMAQLLGCSPTLAHWLSVGSAVFLLGYGLLAWWRLRSQVLSRSTGS